MARHTRRARGLLSGPAPLLIAAGAVLVAVAQRQPGASAIDDAGVRAGEAAEGGVVNPADQRRAMINELRALSARMASLEKALTGSPLEVIVVEMPGAGGGD